MYNCGGLTIMPMRNQGGVEESTEKYLGLEVEEGMD